MKVGIIGGGLMGLALAQRLGHLGHKVTVFEREEQLGGLATYHDYEHFIWDRFYHVILPSDPYLIRFLTDIGLGNQLRWAKTLTGFYVDETFYSMSSSLEFLRFPPVSLLGKIRLALTILYCSRISDWRRLEQITVEDWLIRMCGRSTYTKIWKPLLLAKLGENYRRVSAVFIWSYIKRMFSARETSARKEQLGHVAGGYKTVFDRLEQMIMASGGQLRLGVAVNRVSPLPASGIRIDYEGNRSDVFDRVVFTGPVNILQKVAGDGLLRVSGVSRGSVEYLGVICMVLLTKKPLVPYYVVNIADQRIPFTGVIGMSSLVSTEETAGLYLTYLPKYVLSDDPLLLKPDEELRQLFFNGLFRMFPDLNKEEIVSAHVNRAFKVQPLQVLNYSSLVPKVETEHPDFFVLNTSQFVNCTLNNNEVIRAVDEFIERHQTCFEKAVEMETSTESVLH